MSRNGCQFSLHSFPCGDRGAIWLSMVFVHSSLPFSVRDVSSFLAFCYRGVPAGEGAFSYKTHNYKTVGWLLFLLNIHMNCMVVLMVKEDSGFQYPGVVLYLSALYTFYMAEMSAVNLIKFRRLNSLILLAGKILHYVRIRTADGHDCQVWGGGQRFPADYEHHNRRWSMHTGYWGRSLYDRKI